MSRVAHGGRGLRARAAPERVCDGAECGGGVAWVGAGACCGCTREAPAAREQCLHDLAFHATPPPPSLAACQIMHHHEPPSDVNPHSFKRFLCDSPLRRATPDQYPPGGGGVGGGGGGGGGGGKWGHAAGSGWGGGGGRVFAACWQPPAHQRVRVPPHPTQPPTRPPTHAGGCPPGGFGSFHQQYWLDGEARMHAGRRGACERCERAAPIPHTTTTTLSASPAPSAPTPPSHSPPRRAGCCGGGGRAAALLVLSLPVLGAG